jgi:hypothetical protein
MIKLQFRMALFSFHGGSRHTESCDLQGRHNSPQGNTEFFIKVL